MKLALAFPETPTLNDLKKIVDDLIAQGYGDYTPALEDPTWGIPDRIVRVEIDPRDKTVMFG